MRRLLVVVAFACIALPACASSERPEGIVERWLVSLNQGAAGEPDKYAPEAFSQEILPNWSNRDPGDLDLIEVGRGIVKHDGYAVAKGRSVREYAIVPFRVERASGLDIEREAVVGHFSDGWRVIAMGSLERGFLLPSEGGDRVGSAGPGAWLLAAAVAGGLLLLVVGLMRLGPAPLVLPRRTPE